MKTVLLAQYLISFPHATKMMRALNKKKITAGHDFYFEMIELNLGSSDVLVPKYFPKCFIQENGNVRMYSNYSIFRKTSVPLYHLKVYHTVQKG